MKTSILQKMVVVFLALFGTLHAANDIANFDDGSTFAQVVQCDYDLDTVANPVKDAVNGSDNCVKFTRSHQWNSMPKFGNFEFPINLYDATSFRFKLMTENAMGTEVNIILTDIFDKKVNIGGNKLPDNANEWSEYELNFEEKLKSTPISYIVAITFQLNYGEGIDSANMDVFYIDEIQNSGFDSYFTEDDSITYYNEYITNGFDGPLKGAIGTLWNYNNRVIRGGDEHYNLEDSVRFNVYWGAPFGGGPDRKVLVLDPAATSADFSSITVKQTCAGLDNFGFMLRCAWYQTAVDYPTIEISYNGTDWTEKTTDDEINTSELRNLNFELGSPEVGAETLYIRVTNNQDAVLAIKELKLTATSIFAEDIEIDGPTEIPSDSGQIQLTSTVYPAEANQATYWYISEGSDSATIDHSTGLVTAKGTGYIEVTAIAIDKIGATMTTHDIMIVAGASSIAVGDYEMDVQLYPNPVQDDLFIETPAALSSLSIFSLSGQLVRTVTNGFDKIDVSDLNGGMYFVQMTLGNQVHTQKIIKK